MESLPSLFPLYPLQLHKRNRDVHRYMPIARTAQDSTINKRVELALAFAKQTLLHVICISNDRCDTPISQDDISIGKK